MRRAAVALCLVMGLIGAGRALPARPGAGDRVQPVATTRYVVRAGDTLWDIARAMAPDADPRGVVQELIGANRLRTPGLRPGQTLVLPRL